MELFSEEQINEIAMRHGFIKRNRLISATSFLNTLIFNDVDSDKRSLLDLKFDLFKSARINISKEALHKKFTQEAVSFMEEILSTLLTHRLASFVETNMSADNPFKGIYIKDSSKFKIPKRFADNYPAYGSYGKEGALMNIQYEYELLSGNSQSLSLTKATRNDQQDSKETLNDIQAGGLYLRDLGYITSSYLQAFNTNNAYYLNRLPKIGVYQKIENEYRAICWKDIKKHFDTNTITHHEMEVYIGKKELIKTRLVITPVPKDVASQRIRKAKQGGKRKKGYTISDEYKAKAHFNLFITNIPNSVLSTKKVIETYRLRWQIELVFKTWKSHLNIHKCKPVKIERFKCQLFGKLIWILLSTKLFQIANLIINRRYKSKSCSTIKFFKACKSLKQELRAVLQNPNMLTKWFNESFYLIINEFIIEKRMEKLTHPEILAATLAG